MNMGPTSMPPTSIYTLIDLCIIIGRQFMPIGGHRTLTLSISALPAPSVQGNRCLIKTRREMLLLRSFSNAPSLLRRLFASCEALCLKFRAHTYTHGRRSCARSRAMLHCSISLTLCVHACSGFNKYGN